MNKKQIKRSLKFFILAGFATALFNACGGSAVKSRTVLSVGGPGPVGTPTPTPTPVPTPTPTPPAVCQTFAELIWTKPTKNVSGTDLVDLAGYKIYYGNAPGTYTNIVDIADPTALTYTINGLGPGLYYFAITAYNTSLVESDYTGDVTLNLVSCSNTDVEQVKFIREL